jgi:hypothetical protein
MIVRPYKPEDDAVLREIHTRAAYGDSFPSNIEDFLVVTDDLGCPIMAAGEKMIPEITLVCAPHGTTHPLVKLKGIALLHQGLRERLSARGFTEAIASVPPQLERNYARHLQRHFRWMESWKAFRIQIQKEGV